MGFSGFDPVVRQWFASEVGDPTDAQLRAFADHGKLAAVLSPYGGDCDAVLDAHAKAGVDVEALARKLQSDGAKAFIASWQDLLKSIGAKSKALA